MTVCATCSRELQPEWKYCIYCGTRTGVPLTAAIDIIQADMLNSDMQAGPQHRANVGEAAGATADVPAHAPVGGYDNTDTGVLRIEDIPLDDPTPSGPAADVEEPAKFNVLAIAALVLGCLASPLAALFGHIALSQIGRSGARGTAIAWAAIVLGYLSLAAILVFGISYLVLNA